ncbi:hypothetical protein [Lacimicrobium sp. SS2-24]|uniref:hypothetical protein n=1 Tax=Lacimicrobium sp. SS2-24 TaxID=2005569 RepID=UPI00113197D2|nr:hypothetical protein [Lacimicrobium sp. SS2-24]
MSAQALMPEKPGFSDTQYLCSEAETLHAKLSPMKTLSPYQSAMLTEMGIVQWQLRAPEKLVLLSQSNDSKTVPQHDVQAHVAVEPSPRESATPTEPLAAHNAAESAHTPESQNQEPLALPQADQHHPLFNDIQLALAWLDKDQQIDWMIAESLSFDGQLLLAPAPQDLSLAPAMKKQLWQRLQQH